jgi:hypothetical protein
MLRLGDRIMKFAGIASVGWSYTGGAQSGTIVDGRFTQYPGCIPIAFVIAGAIDTRGGGVRFSFNGNTLTWSYPISASQAYARRDATFVYGIF